MQCTLELQSDKHERLSGFRYLWLKQVVAFTSKHHCADCLIGEYLQVVQPDMPTRHERLFSATAGDIFYLCGVSSPYVWQKNAHLALRAKARSIKGGEFLHSQFQAHAATLRGNYAAAIEMYEQALAQKKKDLNKRQVFFDNNFGAFYLLALLGLGDCGKIQAVLKTVKARLKRREAEANEIVLLRVLQFHTGEEQQTLVRQETPSRYVVYQISDDLRQLAELLAKTALKRQLPRKKKCSPPLAR